MLLKTLSVGLGDRVTTSHHNYLVGSKVVWSSVAARAAAKIQRFFFVMNQQAWIIKQGNKS